MTFSSVLALFGAMVVLAAIPSISVLTVAMNAATSGFLHGVFTAIGIVLGDIIFILIALWGLAFLSETMGEWFFLIKYLSGAYLIGLGMSLWRSKSQIKEIENGVQTSLLSSLLTGFLITIADQKATLFYLGFFPAFIDVSEISYGDTGIVIATAVAAVGGVKLVYALLADRVRTCLNFNLKTTINQIAGCIMIAVGMVLLFKA
ncbi:LysE family translocator [Egbenema bharatensis]|uniref:LysE family translocator n=1 Tax=Egbenema bharatensis TaxID=3463334 RepID=UPI003A896A39